MQILRGPTQIGLGSELLIGLLLMDTTTTHEEQQPVQLHTIISSVADRLAGSVFILPTVLALIIPIALSFNCIVVCLSGKIRYCPGRF